MLYRCCIANPYHIWFALLYTYLSASIFFTDYSTFFRIEEIYDNIDYNKYML